MPLHVKQNIFCKRTIKYIFIGIACCILLYFSFPKTPLISVVIPTYNRADFVEQAIQSVLNQTYSNFEVLVIDDGSTDNSAELIQKMAETDKRIRFYQLKQNSGVSIARNKGLSLARGKYIAFLDSDDTAYPYWLETGVRFMEKNPQTAVGFTNFMYYQLINNQKKFFSARIPLYEISWRSVAHIGSFVRAGFINRHQIQFNPHYISAEDWDFYMQIMRKGGRIERILPAIPLIAVRYHTSNPAKYYSEGMANSIKIQKNVYTEIGLTPNAKNTCEIFKSFITTFPNAFNRFTQKTGIMKLCKKIHSEALFFKHPRWNDYILVDRKNNRLCRTVKRMECAFINAYGESFFNVTWETIESNETFVRVGQTNTFVLQNKQ